MAARSQMYCNTALYNADFPHDIGTVSSKITLVILFQIFQDTRKKSNTRIEMYG